MADADHDAARGPGRSGDETLPLGLGPFASLANKPGDGCQHAWQGWATTGPDGRWDMTCTRCGERSVSSPKAEPVEPSSTPQAQAPAAPQPGAEAVAEALFYAAAWTDHSCVWAEITQDRTAATQGIVRHFRETAKRVLARLARPGAVAGPSLPLSEPREAGSDKSTSEMPFQGHKSGGSSALSDVWLTDAADAAAGPGLAVAERDHLAQALAAARAEAEERGRRIAALEEALAPFAEAHRKATTHFPGAVTLAVLGSVCAYYTSSVNFIRAARAGAAP